jgi:signal transduction histidine kinase
MRSEGRRLTNMVEQTLQFASSQAGKQRYAIETLAPSDLIELAAPESRSELSESGIELALDVAPDLPSVRGESSAVMQCLRNLLSNAVKYRGQSKKISLAAAAEGHFVRFDVSDFGLGISPEDLPHVFEPFYRGRQAVDAQIQGSGLGLSLAKEAAEASGGTLTAASQLGSGSTFTLRLPLAAVQEASA